jgi:uncharacterized membrane protein YfcA
MSLPKKMQRLDAFAAGVLLGLCAITPAFAATLTEALPPREWLLLGLVVLLVLALALRLMKRRTELETGPDTPDLPPDLRWWRNTGAME